MTTVLGGERIVLVSFDSCDPEQAKFLAAKHTALGELGLMGCRYTNETETAEEALRPMRHATPPVDGEDGVMSPLHPVGTLKGRLGSWHIFFEVVRGGVPELDAALGDVELAWHTETTLPDGEDGKRVANAVGLARAALAELNTQMAVTAEGMLTPIALDGDEEQGGASGILRV